MKNNEFNDILKQRALDFKINPTKNAFDKIILQKKYQKKRLVFFYFSASVLFVTCLLATWSIYFKTNKFSNKENKLANENHFKNKDFKKQKNTEINIKEPSKEIQELNKKPKYKIERNIEINTNKNNELITVKKSKQTPNILATENKTKEIQLTNLNEIDSLNNFSTNKNNLLKTNLSNNELDKEDSILTIETSKETITNLSNKTVNPDSISANNHSSVKKLKLGFEFALINQYMLGKWAYNGAKNKIIQNDFGILYDDQAKSAIFLGFLTGININKWSVLLGFNYHQVEFDKLYTEPGSIKNLVSRELYLNDFGYKVNVIDQTLTWYEIPLIVGYKIGSKKVKINFETGISYQYLVETNTYLLRSLNNELSFNLINDYNNLRFERNQFVLSASTNLEYSFSKNFGIFAGPVIKTNLKQYYKNEFTIRNAPIFIGINSGLKFNF